MPASQWPLTLLSNLIRREVNLSSPRRGGVPGRFQEGHYLKMAASLGAPFGAVLTNADAPFCIQAVLELNFAMG